MVELVDLQESRVRLLVVEPHADDAHLSAYSLLSRIDKVEFDLLTCCNHLDRSSRGLLKYYSNLSKVRVLSLSEDDYLWSSKLYNYRSIYNLDKLINTYEYTVAQAKSMSKSYNSDLFTITNALSYIVSDYDYVLAPFGLMHPFHVLVAEACKDIVDPAQLNFYYELDHYNKRMIRRLVFDGLLDSRIPKIINSQYTIHFQYDDKVKYEIFKEVYPSEIKLTEGNYKGFMFNESFLLSSNLLRRL